MYVIKKDGTHEEFNVQKIITAVNKSAARILYTFTDEELQFLCDFAKDKAESLKKEGITIQEMHNIVEGALEAVNPAVAKSYRDYRNYKLDFIHMMDDVYTKSQSIRYIGDKSNANTDSALVATKRSLIFNELNKELYRKFFMTRDELQACKDGYIYIHDQSARLDTMNCCLFNVGEVLRGGFEMGNVWYNEPKTLDTAFDVMGDIILSTAAQQYGGFTVPEVDKILAPYAMKSYRKYKEEFAKYADPSWTNVEAQAEKYARDKVKRDCDQGWQGIEYKLNTVGSSRGDYPFVTVTLGLGRSEFEKLISISLLEVHREGQGKAGNKKPVLFPKIVFLYDENLHGPGGACEDVFEKGIQCSAKTMYPDWLSLTGEGYIASMYKKYGKVISPMGCRAFLSPWYERGGMKPADENDEPVFVGRFNIGAVSLHLPMILAKSRAESRDFYEVLDEYLEMIRRLHIRTYDYLGEMRASTNPLGYCEGGFYGGRLQPGEKIKPLLKPMTASFGITALNELQELYNGKSIAQDGQFALEVLQHINDKVNQYKEEDGWLYAIYGTPAESLCGLQVEQFRKKYGIVENVSDRPYVSNSFHCHVTEDISPIEKQDLEGRFWELCNGGKIQYVRYPIDYNIEAIKSLIRRAMSLGYYEGVNLSLAY
ncbi:MAG: anaerobic ribonucleoside-triphosphate reductase, partial [Candidatus Choladocola sp.]|nr:anaerobic ribonucleoside-triphosphate reductase [Candidatus Choladocola sp.]